MIYIKLQRQSTIRNFKKIFCIIINNYTSQQTIFCNEIIEIHLLSGRGLNTIGLYDFYVSAHVAGNALWTALNSAMTMFSAIKLHREMVKVKY